MARERVTLDERLNERMFSRRHSPPFGHIFKCRECGMETQNSDRLRHTYNCPYSPQNAGETEYLSWFKH